MTLPGPPYKVCAGHELKESAVGAIIDRRPEIGMLLNIARAKSAADP